MTVVDSERAPLLGRNEDNLNEEEGGAEIPDSGPGLDRVGLRCLLIQHLSR